MAGCKRVKRAKIRRYSPKKVSLIYPIGFTIFLIVVVALFFKFYKVVTNSNIYLGTTTFLAKGDDSRSDSSGSGSSGGGESSGSDSDSSNSGSNSGGSSSGDSSSGSSSGSDTSGAGSGGTISQQSSGSTTDSSESNIQSTKSVIVNPNTGVKTIIELKNNESKTEIKLGEGEKIKMRSKDGELRTDIYSQGVKVRFELKDGVMIIKKELEDGTEVDIDEEDADEIETELGNQNIQVASDEGNIVIARGGVAARSLFPVSIDLPSNSLIIQTPAGTRQLAILPDVAVSNLIAGGFIDEVEDDVASSQFAGVTDVVEINEDNGTTVFLVNGISNENLLGFIPVKIKKRLILSTQTGEIIREQQTLIARILDALSF